MTTLKLYYVTFKIEDRMRTWLRFASSRYVAQNEAQAALDRCYIEPATIIDVQRAYDLYRGDHKLPHQSQVIQRDLCAETIEEHLGAKCAAWRLWPDEIHADGRIPYEYLVRYPDSPALSWTAFFNTQDLITWMQAYDLTANIPGPGCNFHIHLPHSTENFKPLHRRLRKHLWRLE